MPPTKPRRAAKARKTTQKPRTAMIRARVQPRLKARAEKIFKALGISPSGAINMLYAQVVQRRGLPFEVAIPNATTRRTLRETKVGKNLVHAKDAEEMFENLGI